MFEKLNYLGITVSERNDFPDYIPDDSGKAAWIIALIAIIVFCLIIAHYLPIIKESLKSKKTEIKQGKSKKERDAELERLHKIKEKNKRK